MNPRYALFIQVTGETRPALYQAWIMQQWSAWRALNGIHPDRTMHDVDHVAFDLWLETQHARFSLIEGGDVVWTGFGHELIADNEGDDEIVGAVAEMYRGEMRTLAGGASGIAMLVRHSDTNVTATVAVGAN